MNSPLFSIDQLDFRSGYFKYKIVIDEIDFEQFVNTFQCSTNISLNGNLIDVMFVPVDGFSLYNCSEAFPSSIYTFSETVIVTSEPKLNVVHSLNFFKMDNWVIVLITVSCFTVSLAITICDRMVSIKRSFIGEFLTNLWNTLCTFFYEPYPRVSRDASSRIVRLSWLLSVLFIVIALSCSFQSEFSIKTYDTISSISDLVNHDDVKPIVMSNGMIYRYAKFKEEAPYMKKFLDKLKLNPEGFVHPLSLANGDIYPILADTRSKTAIVIHREFIYRLLGFGLQVSKDYLCEKLGNDDGVCSLGDLPQIQIGIDDEKKDTLTIILSKQYSENFCIRESVNLAILIMFETKAFDVYDFESHYNIEYVTWKPPLKIFHPQQLHDSLGVFLLYSYALIAATSVFFIEVLVYLIRLGLSEKKKKRTPAPFKTRKRRKKRLIVVFRILAEV